jgi:putative holliday junction resolvase
MAREYAADLAAAIDPIPVEHVDERLSTVSAERKLGQGGVRGRARRAVIDQAAAVELLQHWLDTHQP